MLIDFVAWLPPVSDLQFGVAGLGGSAMTTHFSALVTVR
jgi:hypothetical protein